MDEEDILKTFEGILEHLNPQKDVYEKDVSKEIQYRLDVDTITVDALFDSNLRQFFASTYVVPLMISLC